MGTRHQRQTLIKKTSPEPGGHGTERFGPYQKGYAQLLWITRSGLGRWEQAETGQKHRPGMSTGARVVHIVWIFHGGDVHTSESCVTETQRLEDKKLREKWLGERIQRLGCLNSAATREHLKQIS